MATRLRNLRINRVAHVDKGAGEGVEILLTKRMVLLPEAAESYLKREFSADERKAMADSGAAMPGGGYPIANEADLKNAIHAFGRAKDPAATKAHIIARAKSLSLSSLIPDEWTGVSKAFAVTHADDGQVTISGRFDPTMSKRDRLEDLLDMVVLGKAAGDGDSVLFDGAADRNAVVSGMWEASSALNESICSIIDDAAVIDKGALLQQTLEEFTNHTQDLVAGAVAKATNRTGAELMDVAALKKALGLPDTASDADVIKAAGEKNEEASFGVAVAKMSAAHTAFMNNDKAKMPSGGKKAFANMEPAERDAHMKACPLAGDDDDDDDMAKALSAGAAFKTPEGHVITKKAAGAIFDVLKAQNDQRIADRAEITKLRDKDEVAVIEKRLGALTHLTEPVEKAALLHRIAKADPEAAKAMEKAYEQQNEVLKQSALMREHGSGHGGFATSGEATETIAKLAAEVLTKARAGGDKRMTIEKARTQVRDTNPELAKRESEQRSRAA